MGNSKINVLCRSGLAMETQFKRIPTLHNPMCLFSAKQPCQEAIKGDKTLKALRINLLFRRSLPEMCE